MWIGLLGDSRLYEMLLKFDADLASQAAGGGCRICGGVLHSARYGRKPRGFAGKLAGYDWRYSFCCARDGCRKRTTPPSVRFLGRKVYLGAVVTLVTALRHGPNPRRIAELQRLVGASRRTIVRWQIWWRDVFTATPFWLVARASWVPEVVIARLPASLLERFVGDEERMCLRRFLGFISPITTRTGGRNLMVG
jgi:hypothetical protein